MFFAYRTSLFIVSDGATSEIVHGYCKINTDLLCGVEFRALDGLHVRENARFLHDFRRVSVRVRVRDYGAEYHDIAPIHGLTSFRDNVFIR